MNLRLRRSLCALLQNFPRYFFLFHPKSRIFAPDNERGVRKTTRAGRTSSEGGPGIDAVANGSAGGFRAEIIPIVPETGNAETGKA